MKLKFKREKKKKESKKNMAVAFVCADCKAGHTMLIPLSGLLTVLYWSFLVTSYRPGLANHTKGKIEKV